MCSCRSLGWPELDRVRTYATQLNWSRPRFSLFVEYSHISEERGWSSSCVGYIASSISIYYIIYNIEYNILILAADDDHGDILPRPSNTDSAPTGCCEEPALGNYLCFYAGWPPILTTELFGGLYLYLHFVRIDLKKSPHWVPDGGKLLSWDSSLSLDSMGRGAGGYSVAECLAIMRTGFVSCAEGAKPGVWANLTKSIVYLTSWVTIGQGGWQQMVREGRSAGWSSADLVSGGNLGELLEPSLWDPWRLAG